MSRPEAVLGLALGDDASLPSTLAASPRSAADEDVLLIDHDAWRRAQPSQFPAWLADDLGLGPSTIDSTIRRPTAWDRVRRFVRRSRHNRTDALAQLMPLASRKRAEPRDSESAAA